MRWWTVYGGEVERDFHGERWTCTDRLKGVDGFNYIEGVDEPGLCVKPGRIHTGLNSGYQTINWVFHQGAARIILLGYDMQRGPNGESHHHGAHDGGLPNLGTMPEWVRRMVQLGADLRAQGVEVVNATRRTAITCFERLPIEEALRGKPKVEVKVKAAQLLVPKDLLPREHAAFAAGLAAAGSTDVSVVWGTHKGPLGGRTVFAENGYWSPPGAPYCALAVGGHNGSGWTPEGSPERFERLGIAIRRWRTSGKHILVCPSRGLTTSVLPQPAGWIERTVVALLRYTDREILVRSHPGDWKRLPEHPDVSLRRDLEGAWCAVVWSSAAGLRALAMGIPVIRTAPHWIAADAAGDDLAQIESPPMPDRLPVFHRMASAQWSLEEIESGEAFRCLLQDRGA